MWNLVDSFIPYNSSQMCTSNPDLFLELQTCVFNSLSDTPTEMKNGRLSLNISKTDLLNFFKKRLYLMTTHLSSCSDVKAWNCPYCLSVTPISNLSRYPVDSTFKIYSNLTTSHHLPCYLPSGATIPSPRLLN